MIENLLIFAFSLYLVIKGATLSTRYAAKIGAGFHFSKYIVGFAVVALISIFPETLIAFNAAWQGIPEFGVATIFGSNIADLTLVFAILIFIAGRGMKIESRVLTNIRFYPFFIFLPIAFGLDGQFTRVDGVLLILAGAIFYYSIFKGCPQERGSLRDGRERYKNLLFLILAVGLLLLGSYFIVASAVNIAELLKISPVLIGLMIVSLGTVMPELFFSIKSLKQKDDCLAVGDILGTVLADATIIIGLLAFLSPFAFPVRIIYAGGGFMVLASVFLIHCMRTGRTITRKEGLLLFAFWVIYIMVELVVNQWLPL